MERGTLVGWRTWYIWPNGAEDTLITLSPSNYPGDDDKRVLLLTGAEAIMLRAFGTDAANETADLRITGWSAPRAANGVGPPLILWAGQVVLGANTFTEVVLNAGRGGNANWETQAYYEADTFNPAAGAVQSNLSDSESLAIADKHSVLILPTLGCQRILAEASVKDGVTGTECADLGLIYDLIPSSQAYEILGQAS